MTGYRTLIVAVVVAIGGALNGLDWVQLMPNDPKVAGWIMSGLGVVMGLMRLVTTTPIGGEPK